jgi:hypothetical protein
LAAELKNFNQCLHSAEVSYRLDLFRQLRLFFTSFSTGVNGSACSPCMAGFFCASGSFNVWGAIQGLSMLLIAVISNSYLFAWFAADFLF